MGTEMTSYSAFFDELEKIAEENNRYVTKERLKRMAVAVPVAGAGAFLGHMAGQAVGRELQKSKGTIGDLARRHPRVASKVVPALAAGAVGIPALLAALKSRKTQQYIEHGDDGSK